jgi:hypothetical protein
VPEVGGSGVGHNALASARGGPLFCHPLLAWLWSLAPPLSPTTAAPAPRRARPRDPRALDSGRGELEALQREAAALDARRAELDAEVADRDSAIAALQTEKELQARRAGRV